ncbi:response regulator [Malaciobacter pacificus]|uniref:histidine kinase n=2 Tax=Malaciobacter pacificus TaxID=1080223 RepID=A0A5C2H4S5_9BACT|nr:response regulator [Malaciobacter pacificus]QEP33990.1 two-component system sensor histidine kinase/response regulator fusion protein [Malaciobacter pacificus]
MLLFILNTVSFIFVAVVINKYQKSTIKLEDAYQMQYKSLILAQELRQSSDDLTRMARTYVITGNSMFEEQFKTVFDIRNGDLPRPQRYNGIFWDFYTLGDKKPILDGEKIALKELMQRANFPESELNLLYASKKESDDLTNLEHKAMNAVKGIFQDENGNYTIHGEPNFKLARDIMHSDEYHEAKIRIMKPIDDFYKAFESRTKQKVDEARIIVKELEFYVNVIVLFSIILFLMSFFIILFRIVYPIDYLRKVMMKLSSNDMSVELEKNKYQDEVGDMIASVQIFKDNTEKLIESEHQIKLAMEEATSANKAKSTFLARMSHELRTPLNAILGFANLLRKSSNINEQEKKNLEVIKRSGNHLLNIINEILELSKIEAGKIELVPKTFEFHEFIKDIESMFAFRCESKGLNFKLNVDSNVPNIIKADEQRLRQILINLLGNSLKFTINGEITLNIYAQNKKLFFEVKDTGIGIDIQNQKKIFKPFEQIKKDDYNSQGTGLGLSITKELISLMGGTIYLKSFIGKGSEFYFSINYEKSVKNKLEEKIFTKDIAGIADVNDDKTILVVDDIKENRDLVVQILNQYGFKTYEASSGEEAIDIFKAHSIDLIFMDILMSGLDGLETTQIIRKDLNKKDIPIIALSANVFEEDKQKAYNSGANDFLSKPFDEKELINILQKYLNIEVVFEKQEKVDFKLSFENVPKDFFEKLIYYCLQMDNESIKDLISTNKLDKKSKKFLEDFLEDFDYQSILKICEKYK